MTIQFVGAEPKNLPRGVKQFASTFVHILERLGNDYSVDGMIAHPAHFGLATAFGLSEHRRFGSNPAQCID